MARRTNTEILKKHLIVCEGRDEQEFLIAWLNNPLLAHVPALANEIQVMDFGGNDELFIKLELLRKTSNFEKVRSLLVVRDAEADATNAEKEIQSALQRNGLPVPPAAHVWTGSQPKVGFSLFPDCSAHSQNGTLEDLCLAILADEKAPAMTQEIEMFMQTLKERQRLAFTRPFKTKLHTYFSVHDSFVSLKIGEAAKAGAFNWGSPRLTALQNFLCEGLLDKGLLK